MGEQPAPPLLGERVVASLAQGIVVVDAGGRLLLANSVARGLLGLSGGEQGDRLVAMPGLAPEVTQVVAAALASPTGGHWREVHVRLGDWPRLLGVQWAPLGGGGGPEGVVLSLTDLTEARAAEAADRRLATLTGVGRLTHHVAHELKNPVGALKLYALLLGRHVSEARTDGRELTDKVVRAIDHLSAAINSVTAIGLPGPPAPSPVALATVADECLASVAGRTTDAGIEVVRQYEPKVTAAVDGRLLGQAIQAFVDNAVDAMATGGVLTVSCRQAGPREAEVGVEDTGGGMPAEAQARLFEPFFTTKSNRIGLGTTIASQVIGQHGGRIEVRTELGAGTTVRIVLPAA
jgi:signal transduction histidine kinase